MLIFTACYSRCIYVCLAYSQTLSAVLTTPEVTWKPPIDSAPRAQETPRPSSCHGTYAFTTRTVSGSQAFTV
jgi:hypothetical protein